jgi:hypothetical protein
MRLVAAAVIAPAKIAGHEAADTDDLFGGVADSEITATGIASLG